MTSLKVTKVSYPKNFDGLTEEQIQAFDRFTECNVGLTKGEIIDKFESFKFTIETLEWILYIINMNSVTFNGIGPFLEKGGRIYNIKKKKNDTINALVEENKRLKEEINELKEILEWREDLHSFKYV
tara:strand:- start:82 stop:462 length:381 start_codon:yes stop_codon:yes gene_type:complete